MDGGAWKAAVHGVAEGRTRLSDFTFTFHFHALEKEMDFPFGSAGEESTRNAGDLGLMPGLGSSPGGGYGNPLQYSCLENESPWTE